MHYRIPYGRSTLTFSLPDNRPVVVIEAPNPPPAPDPTAAVQSALDHLLGGLSWDAFRAARSAAVAVNDKTRPVPHAVLLPPLLAKLNAAGIPDAAITIYLAVGTHPPMTAEEFGEVIPPEILARCRVISHDSEDPARLVCLGQTRRGTPVWVNQEYYQADLKIVVGNIEPHQFAGFSGGVKTAAVGLAGIETINANHSLLAHPDSRLGEYETNPTRLDIEEIGAAMGVHLALNAVLNGEREIISVLAGDPREVMRQGVPLSRQACQAGVPRACGLVIASPGGHPKDINVYQAQKALAHAARVAAPGAALILAAACPQGAGSPHYEEWMHGKTSYAEVIAHFNAEGFRIGPHKALLIARDASRVSLRTVSSMDAKLAASLLLNPAADLQSALDEALANLPADALIGILPHASSTIPFVTQG